MSARRTLVRHFIGSLIGRGVLQDDGVEGVRGLLFSIAAGLMTVGVMLPRRFSGVYVDLASLSDPEPFRQALVADSVFMLALPFLFGMAAAALMASSMFPDEVDYLTLVPLPVTKTRIFAAKVLALVIVVGSLLAVLSVFSAIAFPMFTHQRWAERDLLARVTAHGVAAFTSGLFGVLCVVAYQGIGSAWAPRRWLPRLAVIVPCTVITGVILALPFVLRLQGARAWVAGQPAWLAFYPPAWFAGLERVLLGLATPYWQRLAWLGLVATLATFALVAASYAWLFRRFERLALPPPRHNGRPGRADLRPMSVWEFTRATLVRNRLPLLLFLVFCALGFGIVVLFLLNGLFGGSFRWDEPAPQDLLHAVLVLPLVLLLTGLTGLRTAFLLPVQSKANWIFRMNDAPAARVRHLSAVDRACVKLVLLPTLAVAAPLQIWVLGVQAWLPLVLSGLAGLLMVEVMLADWRRVPFTCTWIPGKRPLAFTLVMAICIFALVTGTFASLIQVALFSWPLATLLAGVLLTSAGLARQRRYRAWRLQPLQFEDEPFKLQVLGLR